MPPLTRVLNTSQTVTSNPGLPTIVPTGRFRQGATCSTARTMLSTEWCSICTPLGVPVEPEVKST